MRELEEKRLIRDSTAVDVYKTMIFIGECVLGHSMHATCAQLVEKDIFTDLYSRYDNAAKIRTSWQCYVTTLP